MPGRLQRGHEVARHLRLAVVPRAQRLKRLAAHNVHRVFARPWQRRLDEDAHHLADRRRAGARLEGAAGLVADHHAHVGAQRLFGGCPQFVIAFALHHKADAAHVGLQCVGAYAASHAGQHHNGRDGRQVVHGG